MVGRLRAATPPLGAPRGDSAVGAVALVSTVVLATLLAGVSWAPFPTASRPPGSMPGVSGSVPAAAESNAAPAAPLHGPGHGDPGVLRAPPSLGPTVRTVPPAGPAPIASIFPPAGQVVTTVSVGGAPQGVAFDPANGWVYVTNSATNNVTVLNGTKIVKSVSVGNYPAGAAFNPSNNFVYVTDYYDAAVTVINGTTVVATIHVASSTTADPYAIAFNPSNGAMYVTEYNAQDVAVISGLKVTGNVTVPTGPDAIVYDPVNTEMYVACNIAGSVSAILGTHVATAVRVGSQPTGIAFDVQNGLIYVVNDGGNTVSIIDPTNRVTATVAVGNGPVGAAFDSGNGYVYVADYSGQNLTVLNGTRVVATIGAGFQPFDIAYDALNGCLYTTEEGANAALVVSTLLVESPVVSTPVGNPVASADVGQPVTFNASVWYLSVGTPVASGTIAPATGLSCPPQPTFMYAGGVGSLRWACRTVNATQYVITLNVTDSVGLTVTSTLSFHVYTDPNSSAPVVSIGVRSGLNEADVGQVVNFTEEPTGGTGVYTTYLWETFPINMCGNTSTAHPVCVFTRPYPIPLDLKVVVTDSNGGTSTGPSMKLQVNVMPAASTPTVSRTSADVGQTLNFSTSVSGGSGSITFAWSGLPTGCLGAFTATPSCAPRVADTYSVSVVVTDAVGGSSPRTPSVTATVFSDPKVTSIRTTPSSVTVGNPVLITANVTGGWGNYTFDWSGLPPGCSGRAVTISCRPSLAGSFALTLSVSDQNGFAAKSAAVTVKVVTPTSPGIGDTNGSPVLIFGVPEVVFYALFGTLAIIVTGVGVAIILRSRRIHRAPPPDAGPAKPTRSEPTEPAEEP